MRRHPRIRKTTKWAGALATVLMVVVWIGSGWGYAFVAPTRKSMVAVNGGYFYVADYDRRGERPRPSIGRFDDHGYYLGWWFFTHRIPNDWDVGVPLWIPTGLLALIAATAWRLDTLARRRARVGACPRCGYDRAGLPPTSPCPECDAPPPAAAATSAKD